MSAYKVVFRIRLEYFDQIVRGEKKVEIRAATPRWTRIVNRILALPNGCPTMGVFVCGRRTHRREIVNVGAAMSAEDVFGRKLSPQGEKDIGLGPVFTFELGDEMPKE